MMYTSLNMFLYSFSVLIVLTTTNAINNNFVCLLQIYRESHILQIPGLKIKSFLYDNDCLTNQLFWAFCVYIQVVRRNYLFFNSQSVFMPLVPTKTLVV